MHCIAGLVKVSGTIPEAGMVGMVPGAPLLDALPTEEVTRCETEDDNAQLCGGCARLTAPKAALLDWAVRSEPHGGWGARGEAQQDATCSRRSGTVCST